MFKPRRDNFSGGKKFGSKFGGPKFGSKPGFKRDFHDNYSDEPREAFDATCANCGKDCRVPFKPNGRKPVYCTNCFKKDDGDKPSFRENRSFSGGNSFNDKQVMEQLKLVNAKLDQVLKKLGGDKLDIDLDIEDLDK